MSRQSGQGSGETSPHALILSGDGTQLQPVSNVKEPKPYHHGRLRPLF